MDVRIDFRRSCCSCICAVKVRVVSMHHSDFQLSGSPDRLCIISRFDGHVGLTNVRLTQSVRPLFPAGYSVPPKSCVEPLKSNVAGTAYVSVIGLWGWAPNPQPPAAWHVPPCVIPFSDASIAHIPQTNTLPERRGWKREPPLATRHAMLHGSCRRDDLLT